MRQSIPIQTISVLQDSPPSFEDHSPSDTAGFDDICQRVMDGRGGRTFELTIFLGQLLRALDYDVTFTLAESGLDACKRVCLVVSKHGR